MARVYLLRLSKIVLRTVLPSKDEHLSKAHENRASAESLLDDVRSFADGSGLRDDASIILVKG